MIDELVLRESNTHTQKNQVLSHSSGIHRQTHANVSGTDCQGLEENKSISMANLVAEISTSLK